MLSQLLKELQITPPFIGPDYSKLRTLKHRFKVRKILLTRFLNSLKKSK